MQQQNNVNSMNDLDVWTTDLRELRATKTHMLSETCSSYEPSQRQCPNLQVGHCYNPQIAQPCKRGRLCCTTTFDVRRSPPPRLPRLTWNTLNAIPETPTDHAYIHHHSSSGSGPPRFLSLSSHRFLFGSSLWLAHELRSVCGTARIRIHRSSRAEPQLDPRMHVLTFVRL